MKKLFILISSAALLFASCAKEAASVANTDETVTVSLTASLSEVTKAVADTDGLAAQIDHWILEVIDANGHVFYRDERDTIAGTLSQTFDVILVKNQTFDFLFWADTKGHYDTQSLTAVSDTTVTKGNFDGRDAFTAHQEVTTPYTGSTAVTMKRPFAQLNMISNDLKTLYRQFQDYLGGDDEYAKFEPKNLEVSVNVHTGYNVKTQATTGETTSVTAKADSSYVGYKADTTAQSRNNYFLHREKSTLFMGYFLAPSDESNVTNITFKFDSNDAPVSFEDLPSIPLQANYRTNLTGGFLTDGTQWTVTIDPGFAGSHDKTYPAQ